MVVGGYTHVLTGTKDPSIVAMTVNGISGRITFPTGSTWKLDLILSPGTNTFSIRGRDVVPNWTPEVKVNLALPGADPEAHVYFNTLDQHALIVGIDRNLGEKNWDFRNRLLSYAFARTGANMEGLFHAAAHELGVKAIDQALGARLRRDSYGELRSPEVYCELGPVYFWIDSPDMVKSGETHLVDPRTRSIQLDETPTWISEVRVFDERGNRVQDKRFTVDAFKRTMTFTDDELAGLWISIHYPYRARIDYREMDLDELALAIQGVMVGGEALLEANVATGTGSLAATGLHRIGRTLMTTDWQYWDHARVQVTPLDDRYYQQSMLNRYGAAYDTKLEKFARRARDKSTIGWDNLVLDEGLWEVDVDDRALDFLPRLWDPVFGRWFCPHPADEGYYDLQEYRKYEGRCPTHGFELVYVGLPRDQIKSGICEAEALYADVVAVEEEL